MSINKYGIFIAYPPTVDLRKEGLGRYLAAFLNGASSCDDVQFVIVCSSWNRSSLDDLFMSEGIPKERFEIIAPKNQPLVLYLYDAYSAFIKKRQSKLFKKPDNIVKNGTLCLLNGVEQSLLEVNSLFSFVVFMGHAVLLLSLLFVLSPLLITYGLFYFLFATFKKLILRLLVPISSLRKRLGNLLRAPSGDTLVHRLFDKMNEAESERMLRLIKRVDNIKSWYCPTSFWPSFNQIDAPRLMCVPDVVLSEFPIPFSGVGEDRLLDSFNAVEESITTGEHYVTYSQSVKWNTLVSRYGIEPGRIGVVHHAPNTLNRWVDITGFDKHSGSSAIYSKALLKAAFLRSYSSSYLSGFSNSSVKFIFYASQFRPNKNVVSLLRAYHYLLKKKFISHKLILTGCSEASPLISTYISVHHLENDVICLHSLSVQELAACYNLADLAVNPSLSEGGCPFTFTEALSVDTPVVMARIPVTEEVLTEPDLQEMTFFDPYDWRDMADRIEWALGHHDELLECQRKTYEVLAQRTWSDVVDEHIAILDRIADEYQREQYIDSSSSIKKLPVKTLTLKSKLKRVIRWR